MDTLTLSEPATISAPTHPYIAAWRLNEAGQRLRRVYIFAFKEWTPAGLDRADLPDVYAIYADDSGVLDVDHLSRFQVDTEPRGYVLPAE